jgi:hypothetical protein
MSYDGQDPMGAAKQAECELNSYQAKQGLNNAGESFLYTSLLPIDFLVSPRISLIS